jgi:hypothetical protein
MAKRDGGVVKKGGKAKGDIEAGDVTRDTYGFSETVAQRRSRGRRTAEADRAAGAAGMPGAATPEVSAPGEGGEAASEAEFRRAEVAGDRTASRRDADELQASRERLRTPRVARTGRTTRGR